MIKRRLYLLIIGMIVLTLTACGPNENGNEAQTDGMEGENLTGEKPDVITEDNLEYYAYESGSSSLCERFAVYEYNGEFIFIADYFNCGNELLETYQLSKEETKLFLEEINSVSPAEAEESGERDGAHIENGSLVVDGIYYSVGMIDFASVGIDVKDANDVEYPPEEETEKYEIEGILELQKLEQWKERLVSSGSREFGRSVGKQIEDLSGEQIDRMAIDGFGDEDFIIKAEMQNGNSYRVTVTYLGYVAEAKKE